MKLLTVNEAAELMSVHPNTIRNHLDRFGAVDLNGGKGTNRCIRIPLKAIEAFLQGCVILPPVTTKQVRPTYKLERRKV